ncbi:hypothetical protein GP486_005397 [Trichoglossum hirsutum]|uniref:Uncharacterized protein n=1 Tax=Trichoglossum hirsutum TaxID=265104 RepID=A0A9P8L9J9_9PEZI|nr:hypothetical protein GP486_005397 [Trichoglossum hirsutum]
MKRARPNDDNQLPTLGEPSELEESPVLSTPEEPLVTSTIAVQVPSCPACPGGHPVTWPDPELDMKLDKSLSQIKYSDIAPYVSLDPIEAGDDICRMELFRSRLPLAEFLTISHDVEKAETQYGVMPEHGSISIIFIEVKRDIGGGANRLDVLAQVLAECLMCDFQNSKRNLWVPILAIFGDGGQFEFLVYNSIEKTVHSSGVTAGVVNHDGLFTESLKIVTEWIFDYFLMGYINALRAFVHKSQIKAEKEGKKRMSTENWVNALSKAERALYLGRRAAKLGAEAKYTEAEEIATKGIEALQERFSKNNTTHHKYKRPYVLQMFYLPVGKVELSKSIRA